MPVPPQKVPQPGSWPATKSLDRSTGLPFVVGLDDSDTPYDVVDALALAPFTTGEQPWAHSARIDRLRSGASLLPAGAQVLRTVVEDSRDSRLAAGEGWTLRAVRWRGGGGEVTVTAVSEELARTVLDGVVREAVAESEADSAVTMGFWYMSARRGPTRTAREAATTSWASIRRNYASSAVGALDRLMTVSHETLVGRLILLHGPAGTGKTTVLRALAHEWRRWCQVDCVLDPESLFADPGYLMEVAIGFDDDGEDETEANDPDHSDQDHGDRDDGVQDDGGDDADGPGRHIHDHASGESGASSAGDRDMAQAGKTREVRETRRRWRLLVIEDCDELVRGDLRGSSGQALSRLLNLTDGLVGQGRDVLVALTTNDDLTQLHPAIVRPGRCLAQVEVGPLSYDEATAWLGTTQSVGPTMTLAELFALRDGRAPVQTTKPDAHSGPYL
ncbi:DUF5925 domain-containing protein [Frankia sp. Cas8]|uniref:DUF5925 domain-containing protein n=1 Tax=unclassified Frankia TaxID=2632575 RepID=UPI003A0FF24E